MRRGSVALAAACVSLLAPAAAAAQDELSVSDRLQDRRWVAAGERAFVLGFQDGSYQATGFHTQGEMGGVWTQPLKLLDGIWFSVDGQWVGKADRFVSGQGYVRQEGPTTAGVGVQRTTFAPDARRGALFGLTLTNPGTAAKSVTVGVDAHSELMNAYPWEETKPTAESRNGKDAAVFDGSSLLFTDGAYAAAVGASQPPVGGDATGAHRGPQGDVVCGDQFTCDDGKAGKGAGGGLQYAVTVPAGGETTLWVAATGSDAGPPAPDVARAELAAALQDPAAQLAAKRAERARQGGYSRVSLPGDRRLQRGIEWGKQNLLDLTQRADRLRIRPTEAGTTYPDPVGDVASARWIGAGYPDYPWLFATDGEYTAFAAVAAGQFEAIADHAKALRDVSVVANGDSGKIVHEVVADGTVFFGANADEGNTDESAKYPSMVALIWRWTGDDAFLEDLYPNAVAAARFVVDDLDDDKDGWPSGAGNVERPGMGDEKLDNATYLIRGLYDLADMARARGDAETVAWAQRAGRRLRAKFERTWWQPRAKQFADSLEKGNRQVQQKHWIGQVPMDAELVDARGRAVPGLAAGRHGRAAIRKRYGRCWSGHRPYNRGLYHTGCGGGPDGKGLLQTFGLNSAIQAVGAGNYGLLSGQKRYTDAIVEPMFAQPWTNGTPDEQPGAMPEIPPSPATDAEGRKDSNILQPTRSRSMVMQAWNAYGTLWPVVHQQLGIRPDLGRGRLTVVPQVPTARHPVAADRVRLGSGALATVSAARDGQRRFRTVVDTGDAPVQQLRIGVTVPYGFGAFGTTLDGRATEVDVRRTNRGLEITVPTGPGRHRLVVTKSDR